jgi:hypothetical protein
MSVAFFARLWLLAYALSQTFPLGVVSMTVSSRVMETPTVVEWDKLPLMLDETRAASALGVSVSYLRKARCEGVLKHRTPAPPFVPVGGRRYYRTTDLKAWVDNLVPQQVI